MRALCAQATQHCVCIDRHLQRVAALRAQVFVTATARSIELGTALVTAGSILLLVGPEPAKSQLLARMDKYIFPADKVTVSGARHACAVPRYVACVGRRCSAACGLSRLCTQRTVPTMPMRTARGPARVPEQCGAAPDRNH